MNKLDPKVANYKQSIMNYSDLLIDSFMTHRLSHFTIGIDGQDPTKVAVTPSTVTALTDVTGEPLDTPVSSDIPLPIVVSWKGKVYHFDLNNMADGQALQTVLPDTINIPVPIEEGDISELKVVVYATLQEANREIIGLHFVPGEIALEFNSVLPELQYEVLDEGIVPIGIITIKVPYTASEAFVGGTSDLDNSDYEVIYEDISSLFPRFASIQ